MAIPIDFFWPLAGASLVWCAKRDGTPRLYYDFASTGPTPGAFAATPTTLTRALTADPLVPLNYLDDFATPSDVWTNGDYAIYILDGVTGNQIAAPIKITMANGSSATVVPSGAGTDPWNADLTTYGVNTAGKYVHDNLNAPVANCLTAGGYTVPPTTAQIVNAVWDEPHSGHTTAGTFGKFLDSQVSLISGGSGNFPARAPADWLDDIPVDTGINIRQSHWYILAHAAGDTSGAAAGQARITIKSPVSAIAAIVKDCDPSGNRTHVSLSNPPDTTP